MTQQVIPTRRIDGAWCRQGRAGWQPITGELGAMISDVLDLWPDAVVSVEVPDKQEETPT